MSYTFCVFGSCSKSTSARFCSEAAKLGELLAKRGHKCVNGGGEKGCIGALNESCIQAGGHVINVTDPNLDDERGYPGAKEILEAPDGWFKLDNGTTISRKTRLRQGTDCIIVLPGGAGTFDEVWNSMTAYGEEKMPLVCMSIDNYYEPMRQMTENAKKENLISDKRYKMLHYVADAEEAIKLGEKLAADMQKKRAESK